MFMSIFGSSAAVPYHLVGATNSGVVDTPEESSKHKPTPDRLNEESTFSSEESTLFVVPQYFVSKVRQRDLGIKVDKQQPSEMAREAVLFFDKSEEVFNDKEFHMFAMLSVSDKLNTAIGSKRSRFSTGETFSFKRAMFALSDFIPFISLGEGRGISKDAITYFSHKKQQIRAELILNRMLAKEHAKVESLDPYSLGYHYGVDTLNSVYAMYSGQLNQIDFSKVSRQDVAKKLIYGLFSKNTVDSMKLDARGRKSLVEHARPQLDRFFKKVLNKYAKRCSFQDRVVCCA